MVAELREALDSREPVSNVIVTQEGDFQESLTATKEPPVLMQEEVEVVEQSIVKEPVVLKTGTQEKGGGVDSYCARCLRTFTFELLPQARLKPGALGL